MKMIKLTNLSDYIIYVNADSIVTLERLTYTDIPYTEIHTICRDYLVRVKEDIPTILQKL